VIDVLTCEHLIKKPVLEQLEDDVSTYDIVVLRCEACGVPFWYIDREILYD